SPVINLERTMLTTNQLRAVAEQICNIYEVAYGKGSNLTNADLEQIVSTVAKSQYRVAKPRLLCRLVVDQLEQIRQGRTSQNPETLIASTAAALLQEADA